MRKCLWVFRSFKSLNWRPAKIPTSTR